MSLSGFFVGLLIFIFTLFLSLAMPTYLTGLSTQALDVLKIFLLTCGAVSIFIGALARG